MLPTRLWSNGMISASQADDPGSIPGSRTSLFSESARDLVKYVMVKDAASIHLVSVQRDLAGFPRTHLLR